MSPSLFWTTTPPPTDMKRRQSLLSRVASLFRRKEVQPAPVKPRDRRGGQLAKVRGIEALEGRIAPASLISANTIQYTDLDGDQVMVTFSKALFDPAQTPVQNKLDQIFTF